MNLIVPFGSSILGAIIGGAFLLGGQRWIKHEQSRHNARIILIFFLRKSHELDRLINSYGEGVKIIMLDFNTDPYHEREQYLFTSINVERLEFIYQNVASIDNMKKSLINHVVQPDTTVSYGYLQSLQKSMITILDNLKPFAYRSKSDLKKIDQALINLKQSYEHFASSMPVNNFLLRLDQQGSQK